MPTGERYASRVFCAAPCANIFADLYLMGFLQLRSVFSTQELRELGETMAERGLRMRVGLDEALGDWEALSGPVSALRETEDVGEEDIEHRAEEFRRLRPY